MPPLSHLWESKIISDGLFSNRYSGFRNFFGFSRKSTGESIAIQKNTKLVMGYLGFRFLLKIDKGIDRHTFLVMFRSNTGKNNRLPILRFLLEIVRNRH